MTTAGGTTRPLPGPGGLDNLRYLRRLFSDVAPTLDDLNATYGPVVAVGVPGVRIVIIGDPSAMQQMFSTKADRFRWSHKFNVVGVRFVVGKRSMLVSDGSDHQRRRSAVQRAFTRPRLNGWIPMILARTDAAVDRVIVDGWQRPAGTPLDLYPAGRELILGITLHAFFGAHLAERVDEFSQLFLRAQAFIEAPAVRQLPHRIPFTARARVRSDRRRIDSIIDAELAQRRAHPTGDPHDILEILAHDDSLDDSEIRDQVDTLIGAGYDTTASALAWLLWRAVTEPGVWQRLRDEADDILGPADGPAEAPDEATLGRLQYAQRVVHESLRLHPAGLIAVRLAHDELRIDNMVIAAGSLVVWSPYLAGRDPGSWAEPQRFDPDRYLDLSEQQQRLTDQAWVPFGRGPHMCLGFALAQMELVLIVARFAQRLDLTTDADHLPKPVGMVVNRPLGGAPFHVCARPADGDDLR